MYNEGMILIEFAIQQAPNWVLNLFELMTGSEWMAWAFDAGIVVFGTLLVFARDIAKAMV